MTTQAAAERCARAASCHAGGRLLYWPTALEATIPGGKPASTSEGQVSWSGLASLSSSSLEHSTSHPHAQSVQDSPNSPMTERLQMLWRVEHTGNPRLPLRWKSSFLLLPAKHLPRPHRHRQDLSWVNSTHKSQ